MINLSPFASEFEFEVLLLKRLLLKFSKAPQPVLDRNYDKKTIKIVKELQLEKIPGVPPNHLGWVGPKTWKLLGLKYDIKYNCYHISQSTPDSCWIAAISMILSSRSAEQVIPTKTDELILSPKGGIEMGSKNIDKLAKNNLLEHHLLGHKPNASTLCHVLAMCKGPIVIYFSWKHKADGHFVVCNAIYGDGTNTGTLIHILDPEDSVYNSHEGFLYDVWIKDKEIHGVLFNRLVLR